MKIEIKREENDNYKLTETCIVNMLASTVILINRYFIIEFI